MMHILHNTKTLVRKERVPIAKPLKSPKTWALQITLMKIELWFYSLQVYLLEIHNRLNIHWFLGEFQFLANTKLIIL